MSLPRRVVADTCGRSRASPGGSQGNIGPDAAKTKGARGGNMVSPALKEGGSWGKHGFPHGLKRGPDLQLLAGAANDLVGELTRARVAAEVGGAGAVGDRFQAGLADRAAGLLGLLVAVPQQRRAGQDHR